MYRRSSSPLFSFAIVAAATVLLWGLLSVRRDRTSRRVADTHIALVKQTIATKIASGLDTVVHAASRWSRIPADPGARNNATMKLLARDLERFCLIEGLDATFHVTWTLSAPGRTTIKPGDLARQQEDAAVAARPGEVTVTDPFYLGAGQTGIGVYVPLFEEGRLAGYVRGYADLGILLQEILISLGPETTRKYYTVDIRTDGQDLFHYSAAGVRQEGATDILPGQTERFDLLGTSWEVSVSATEDLKRSLQSWMPEALLAFGVIMAALAALGHHHFRTVARAATRAMMRMRNRGIRSDHPRHERFRQLLSQEGSWMEIPTPSPLSRDPAMSNQAEFLEKTGQEIRDPLDKILHLSDHLADSGLDSVQSACMNKMRSSIESLLRTAADMQDFGRLERGMVRTQPMDFDLRAAFLSSIDHLKNEVDDADFAIDLEIDPDVPTRVSGNPVWLDQVLVRMFDETVNTARGGRAGIRIRVLEQDPTRVTIRVDIHGTEAELHTDPMPDNPPSLQKILEKTAVIDLQRHGPGDLGIFIAGQLVSRMGGEIGVENGSGNGCRLWFSIRLDRPRSPQHSNPGESSPRGRKASQDLHRIRVLCLDPNPVNLDILIHQLHALGIRFRCAADSGKALELLREGQASGDPFQIVILNHQMLGKGSFTLAERIRGDSRMKGTSLILFSAMDSPGDQEMATRVGINACVRRPVTQGELRHLLDTVLPESGAGCGEVAPRTTTLHRKVDAESGGLTTRIRARRWVPVWQETAEHS